MKKEITDTPKLSAKAYINKVLLSNEMIRTEIISEYHNILNITKCTPDPQTYLRNTIIKYHESIISNCEIIGRIWKRTGWNKKNREVFFIAVDSILNNNLDDIALDILEAEFKDFLLSISVIDFCIDELEAKHSKNDSIAGGDNHSTNLEPRKGNEVADNVAQSNYASLPNIASLLFVAEDKCKYEIAISEFWSSSKNKDVAKCVVIYKALTNLGVIEENKSGFIQRINADFNVSIKRVTFSAACNNYNEHANKSHIDLSNKIKEYISAK